MIVTTEKVWEEFNSGLRQFILKRVPDDQSAEDVLQDVFLKIHTHIDALKDRDKLPGWVYSIARNAITDYYRHQQKTTIEFPEIPYVPHDPMDDVINELAPCIKAMVDTLPENYRQALILTEYEGLSQKELGERLGISFSGAKSRVQRAREKLKDMLLECCHFEFDRLGRIIDYQPRCNSCSCCEKA